MTIVVAVKVNDGLVLAADSAVAVHGGLAGKPPGILKTYDYGRKLSHIKDYPIGTLSWGGQPAGFAHYRESDQRV